MLSCTLKETHPVTVLVLVLLVGVLLHIAAHDGCFRQLCGCVVSLCISSKQQP